VSIFKPPTKEGNSSWYTEWADILAGEVNPKKGGSHQNWLYTERVFAGAGKKEVPALSEQGLWN